MAKFGCEILGVAQLVAVGVNYSGFSELRSDDLVYFVWFYAHSDPFPETRDWPRPIMEVDWRSRQHYSREPQSIESARLTSIRPNKAPPVLPFGSKGGDTLACGGGGWMGPVQTTGHTVKKVSDILIPSRDVANLFLQWRQFTTLYSNPFTLRCFTYVPVFTNVFSIILIIIYSVSVNNLNSLIQHIDKKVRGCNCHKVGNFEDFSDKILQI